MYNCTDSICNWSCNKTDISTLLRNRRYDKTIDRYTNLVRILKENYEVEDENLIPFGQLKIRQLSPELRLRKLPDNGRKAELIQRLKSNKIPKIVKMPRTETF